MKSLAIQPSRFLIPNLFQIAAQIEKPVVPPAPKPATLITQKEFAALRKQAMKSASTKSLISGVVGCGWSFPIRK